MKLYSRWPDELIFGGGENDHCLVHWFLEHETLFSRDAENRPGSQTRMPRNWAVT